MNLRWSPNWLRLRLKAPRIPSLVNQCAAHAFRSCSMFHNSYPPSTFQLKRWIQEEEQISVCQVLWGSCLSAVVQPLSNYLFSKVMSKHTLVTCYHISVLTYPTINVVKVSPKEMKIITHTMWWVCTGQITTAPAGLRLSGSINTWIWVQDVTKWCKLLPWAPERVLYCSAI